MDVSLPFDIQTDWIRLEEALNSDAVDLFKIAAATPSDTNRRVVVRAVFAYVEGMSFLLRQNALSYHTNGHLKYEPAEVAVLKEESFSLNDQGRIETRPERRFDTRRMLRFSVSMFGRFFDSAYTLDCGGTGWASFCQALDIRHRVTHPRSGSALEITDNELKTVWSAFTWFHDQMRVVFERTNAELERQTQLLRDTRAALEAVVATREKGETGTES